jgi:hypothetical protein
MPTKGSFVGTCADIRRAVTNEQALELSPLHDELSAPGTGLAYIFIQEIIPILILLYGKSVPCDSVFPPKPWNVMRESQPAYRGTDDINVKHQLCIVEGCIRQMQSSSTGLCQKHKPEANSSGTHCISPGCRCVYACVCDHMNICFTMEKMHTFKNDIYGDLCMHDVSIFVCIPACGYVYIMCVSTYICKYA